MFKFYNGTKELTFAKKKIKRLKYLDYLKKYMYHKQIHFILEHCFF